MKLCTELVKETANALRNSNSVPLPGGHGVWFPDTRYRYAQLVGAPKFEARCYVCLTLLGDGDGEQRWNPKEWWPHTQSWFDIYCPEIAQRLDGPRWAYFLAAMLQVAETWLVSQPEHRHLTAYIADCHARAQDRLRPMTRGKGGLASFQTMSDGKLFASAKERWSVVANELAEPHSIHVELLLFLHILHSQLGIAQHSLDEQYSTRAPFYKQLKMILEQGIGLPTALCEAGFRIALALSETNLLKAQNEEAFSTAELATRLPTCFQLAHAFSKAPPRKLLEMQLAQVPLARDRLLAAYDLAEAVANIAMDIFLSGDVNGPAFKPGAYDYLHSLIRYGPKMYAEQSRQGALPVPKQPPTDRSMLRAVPMTRSFAERMRGGLLVGPARERLKEDFGVTIDVTNMRARAATAAPEDRGSL